jgi:ribonuclease Z
VTRAGSSFRVVGFAIAFGVAAASWALTCAAWRFDRVAAGVVPLDPREFPRLTLLVLGSGGAHPDPNRRGPALALAQGREIALVDAGRGVAESLRSVKIPVSQPGVVVLTSLLPENTVGLDDLLAARALAGAQAPLRLYGPPGTAALARELSAALRPGLRALRAEQGQEGEPPGFEARDVEDGFELEHGEMKLRAGALPGGPTPALAWRFEWRGRTALVTSAGWSAEALVAQARGANLWVHEAVLLPTPEQARELGIEEHPEQLLREAALHTGVSAVGELAQRAGIETLVLVRLRPPPVYDLQITSLVDDAFDGRVVVAEDGEELTP